MAFQITTFIDIDAPTEKVWATLTDFERYPLWSPFIQKIEGYPQVGKKIKVTLPGMTFRPRVVALDHGKHFSWLGNLLFKGIFDGEHHFILSELANGGTRLEHSEKISGVLTRLFQHKLDVSVNDHFIMFNTALKNSVENPTFNK